MRSKKAITPEEPGGTTNIKNVQTVEVSMLNHVISVLQMVRNVIIVEKAITGQGCAAQRANLKHETDTEEIIENDRTLEQEVDKIGKYHQTPVI